MQRAKGAHDGKHEKPQGDLRDCIARQPEKRIALRLAARWQRKPRRQPEPIDRGQHRHDGENDELQHQYPAV
jgi:hypothetical protein